VAIAHEGVAHQTNNQKQHQIWLKSQKPKTNLNESWFMVEYVFANCRIGNYIGYIIIVSPNSYLKNYVVYFFGPWVNWYLPNVLILEWFHNVIYNTWDCALCNLFTL
jgi:hypothetical protein